MFELYFKESFLKNLQLIENKNLFNEINSFVFYLKKFNKIKTYLLNKTDANIILRIAEFELDNAKTMIYIHRFLINLNNKHQNKKTKKIIKMDLNGYTILNDYITATS